MSAVIYQIPNMESPGTFRKILGRFAEIKRFSEDWLAAREERFFGRIARITMSREDGVIQLEVWFRIANETNDAIWFSNGDLAFVANVRGRWTRFAVSHHSGWSDRMAIAMLSPAEYQMDEHLFADFPATSILVESNGYRALYSQLGRLPLAP